MTFGTGTNPTPRRGRKALFIPVVLLIAIAVAWSAGWFWAAGKAGETIDVWLKREADRGRAYACAKRDVGGFPFRIEVACANPSARIAASGGAFRADAPKLTAVAQVWDPRRVIAELDGPVTFTAPDGTRGSLAFSLAQGSARASDRRIDRASLRLETPRLTLGDEDAGTAAAVEAHLRTAPGEALGTYDVAASVEGGVSPLLALLPVGEGPVAAELRARGAGPDVTKPGPLVERLKAFADGGGRVVIERAKVTRGDVAAEAVGDLALDRDGRLDGRLDVTARGVDAAVNAAIGADEGDAMSALIGMGAKMLGKKTELDGRAATRYRLKFDRGRVSLGPIKLTRVPPAF